MRTLPRPSWICAGAALLVLAALAAITAAGAVPWSLPASEHSNNLLVRAFRAGQLALPVPVPPGLAALKDPFDPAANLPYRLPPYALENVSYYRGALYLYFGAVPALLLFWPWSVLTGAYLANKFGAAIFCGAAFLAAAWLLRSVRRACFPQVASGVLAAGLLAVGLATGLPILLERADVCEVPIACGAALVLLALGCVWQALAAPERRGRWLLAASLAYGLALGARPSWLPGCVMLLVPVWAQAREPAAGPGRTARALAAAALPLLACGLGLAWYNWARFGSPLEFGEHYQLAADRQDSLRHFSLGYLAFNFRVYFLEPVRWSPVFPFAGSIAPAAPGPGHGPVEDPYGVLANVPVTLLALAAPLAWRGGGPESRALRRLGAAAGLLFLAAAGVICLFYCNCSRYEVEFLLPLTVLAVLGIFGLERALAGGGPARVAARCGWALLLAFSVAFNLLSSADHYATEHASLGRFLLRAGRLPEATAEFRRAASVRPSAAEHYALAGALAAGGQLDAAIGEYRASIARDGGRALVHNDLAIALARSRRLPEAAEELQAALRLQPAYGEAMANLGNVYLLMRRLPEAIAQYQGALRLAPGDEALRARLALAERAWEAYGR